MNSTDNPLVADCGVENSGLTDIENQIADEKSIQNTATYFRHEPIEMITEVNYKQEHTVNAFNATIDSFGTPTNNNHFISYKGKLYKRDDFLYAFFPDYKKHKKRVKFLNDNILYLSSNQRNKLQYHILAQRFNLLSLDSKADEQDKEELLLFLRKYKRKHEQAQQWHNRMSWEQGHEKVITFGVSLEVQGASKGVWCYTCNIDDDKAMYKGVLMDWKTWLKPIADRLNVIREQIRLKCITNKKLKALYYGATYESIKEMLYNQNYRHLTLPATEINKIRAWVYNYLDDSNAPFPYSGNMPNADLHFTIDFEKDIEIVDTLDLKSPAKMADFNRLNNDRHNKELGRRRSWETFGRLVGNEWTTAEIRAQGFTDKQIRTWRGYGWVEVKGKTKNTLVYKRVLL